MLTREQLDEAVALNQAEGLRLDRAIVQLGYLTERQLLEQQLATEAAERQTLELKSQLYASIGIMAGSDWKIISEVGYSPMMISFWLASRRRSSHTITWAIL